MMLPFIALALAVDTLREAAQRALVRAIARRLPQPPAPPASPAGAERATMRASELAASLWHRYHDPANDAGLTDHGRKMAILFAAVLDDETVRWLAEQIQLEYQDGPEKPPLSYEVHS